MFVEHLYTESVNDKSSMETENFKNLMFVWTEKFANNSRI
ncbi:hypothetical protein I33_1343 [Bacillus subtilis subsp. subtilis str. RO-NN-1]|nr:hypothetical protein I33_1343 [Bacillus subtilis subsp. subtilis str. RO-NN-1]